MPWPEITLRDLTHFGTLVHHLTMTGPAATTAYACRGQARISWTLKPSLTRVIGAPTDATNARILERDCVQFFTAQAHLHVPRYDLPPENDLPAWWALMQHHRAPTRLLDWTVSPFVAAYFACEDHWDEDGAIWLIHLEALITATGKENGRALTVLFPDRPSDRMAAQQGLFIYAEDPTADHQAIIDVLLEPEHRSGKGEVYRKIVIPRALKPQFMRYLRGMNVTGASLFPGTDGLGRAASELVRLSRAFPR